MTLEEEGKRLRVELSRLGSLHGRRYTPGIRALILGWVDRAKREGISEAECGRRLGIPGRRFSEWRSLARREQAHDMVPVEVHDEETPSLGLMLVAPSGYRVDGLTVEQAIAMLRALS